MLARAAALLLSLAAAAPADGQQIVTSPAPDSVSVTVYRDPNGGEMDLDWLSGYALITETRTVSLPAGDSVIRFEGVAGNILPVSAIVRGLPREAAEKNYDARLISAGALVDASLGRQVHIRRTDRATGRVTETEAIIRSGPDGIVLQTSQGIEALRCSGLPETLVYSEAPPGLSAKPTLAVTTRATAPVTATLQLSYLASQFDWRANYVASIAPDGRTLDLFAWLTLANANDESFVDAGTQVVAGRPNRAEDEEDEGASPVSPQINLSCWPAGTTSDLPYQAPIPVIDGEEYGMEGADIIVTGSRIPARDLRSMSPITAVMTAELETLGDLKLYRIPEPVTVAANAQKQVALLHRERVRFERLHVVRMDADEDDETRQAAILIRTRNVEARGLGRPLPSGRVAVFEQSGDRSMLAGEASLDDTPVGQDVELEFGESPDVAATTRFLPRRKKNRAKDEDEEDGDKPRRFEVVVSNAGPRPVEVEVKLELYDDDFELVRPSRKLVRKDGRWLWRARVAASAAARLVYTIKPRPAREIDEEDEDS